MVAGCQHSRPRAVGAFEPFHLPIWGLAESPWTSQTTRAPLDLLEVLRVEGRKNKTSFRLFDECH
jgi:hypothetical protein